MFKVLKIKNILVSQPTPAVAEKSPYYEIVKKYGTRVDYRSFIRVDGVSLKEFRSQRVEILEHTAVIFTSRTTVDNFFRICEEARISVPETMKYICNTEAVALYLQKYIVYRKRKISFADGSFTSFMELIMKYKDEKMLLVLSEPYKPEIAETMEKLNMNFDKVILSRTVSADLSDVDRSKYDMFVFFSPSEIVSLTANFGHDDLPMIATFGDGTTRAAINAGLRVNVKAPTPEAPSMAKAIDIFIGKINSGKEVAPVEFQESRQADEFIKAQDSKSARKSKQRTSLNGSAQQPEKLSGTRVKVSAKTGTLSSPTKAKA